VSNQGKEALISQMMADFSMTREEAIAELTAFGGL
jgi:hypothetical protein